MRSINSVLLTKDVYKKNISNNDVFDKDEEKFLHLLYLMGKALIKIFIKLEKIPLNVAQFQILFCKYDLT